MGMYTEFYFRADIKEGPVADWLERQIVGGEWFEHGYDDHAFFDCERWSSVFMGGGAVYQESRRAIFRRKKHGSGEPYYSQLILASSLKDYGSEIEHFVDWITPHLRMSDGDLLGYSLYEDSVDQGYNGWGGAEDDPREQWRDHPTLYFHNREPVRT